MHVKQKASSVCAKPPSWNGVCYRVWFFFVIDFSASRGNDQICVLEKLFSWWWWRTWDKHKVLKLKVMSTAYAGGTGGDRLNIYRNDRTRSLVGRRGVREVFCDKCQVSDLARKVNSDGILWETFYRRKKQWWDVSSVLAILGLNLRCL